MGQLIPREGVSSVEPVDNVIDDLSGLANASISNAATNAVTYTFPNGYGFNFAGSGFTYDAFGKLDGGTITSVTYFAPGSALLYTVIQLSLSAASLSSFVAVNNFAGLAGAIYGADDRINGTNFADTLHGYGGNDTIDGGAGDDTLVGGDGSDTIYGGLGVDTLDGGAGDDIFYASIDDVIIEQVGGGTDRVEADGSFSLALFAAVENLTISSNSAATGTGNDLDNRILGGNGNDTLNGGAGNDTLNGRNGVDTLVGGLGNDTYLITNTQDAIVEDALGGTDTVEIAISNSFSTYSLSSVNFVENIIVNEQSSGPAASVYGNSLDNNISVFSFDARNDFIDGGEGADTMSGGFGNDIYIVDNIGDVVVEQNTNGFSGLDTIRTTLATLNLSTANIGAVERLEFTGTGAFQGSGNALDNVMIGGAQNDTLNGMTGNDTLTGAAGDDTLLGGDGTDTLNGGVGDDTLIAGSQNDVLSGDIGNDILFGELGDDVLSGGDGDDQLFGQADNDTLIGGFGADFIVSGDGNDVAFGEYGDDTMIGGAGDDRLYGQDGVDVLFGETGADTLVGGLGDDRLYGQDGVDALFGEQDNDILVAGFGDDTLIGGVGNDTLFGEFGDDLLIGGTGADTMFGQDGVDVLFGEVGDDILVGGLQDDRLYGQDGNDTLSGELGADVLDGGDGSDFLIGGADTDFLTGGAGADNFYLFVRTDATDMIFDFNRSQGDKFVVNSEGFGAAAGFQLTSGTNFLLGAGAVPVAAVATFYFDTVTRALWFDVDGTGNLSANVVAFLLNAPALEAGDFLFI